MGGTILALYPFRSSIVITPPTALTSLIIVSAIVPVYKMSAPPEFAISSKVSAYFALRRISPVFTNCQLGFSNSLAEKQNNAISISNLPRNACKCFCLQILSIAQVGQDVAAYLRPGLLVMFSAFFDIPENKCAVTLNPSRASFIAGWNRSFQGNLPYFFQASSYPRSSPGIPTNRPSVGTRSCASIDAQRDHSGRSAKLQIKNSAHIGC